MLCRIYWPGVRRMKLTECTLWIKNPAGNSLLRICTEAHRLYPTKNLNKWNIWMWSWLIIVTYNIVNCFTLKAGSHLCGASRCGHFFIMYFKWQLAKASKSMRCDAFGCEKNCPQRIKFACCIRFGHSRQDSDVPEWLRQYLAIVFHNSAVRSE